MSTDPAVGEHVMAIVVSSGTHSAYDASSADELVRKLGADVVLPRGDDFAQLA